MRVEYGDLWDFHAQGHWICITTNGAVRTDGKAIMRRGCAEQAAIRFPKLPALVGNRLATKGNIPTILSSMRIITFPVKHHWKQKADVNLIIRSAKHLMTYLDDSRWGIRQIYLPRPGCGNGQLDWHEVAPFIAPILDDRVIAITWSR